MINLFPSACVISFPTNTSRTPQRQRERTISGATTSAPAARHQWVHICPRLHHVNELVVMEELPAKEEWSSPAPETRCEPWSQSSKGFDHWLINTTSSCWAVVLGRRYISVLVMCFLSLYTCLSCSFPHRNLSSLFLSLSINLDVQRVFLKNSCDWLQQLSNPSICRLSAGIRPGCW